jgi:Spy/CpxP family protein refolding chaperone
MKTITTIACILLLATTFQTASAQHHAHQHGGDTVPPPASYEGQQTRAIKSLSNQEQQDWLEGKGMGLAKAAELNGYPGPMHVLEHAEALKLTSEQREKTNALLQQHKTTVRAMGQQLVEQEKNLDTLFVSTKITPEQLRSATSKIALLQGQIRAEHLQTHLEQKALLTDEQVGQYKVLRGYSNQISK